MVKPFLMGLALILVMAFVVACGSAEEPVATAVPAAEPTAVPPTEAPAPTEAMEEEERRGRRHGDVRR